MSEKCFKLIWTSQNGEVTLDRGEYASIPEASADLPAAEARLHVPRGRAKSDGKLGTISSQPIQG